VTDVVLLAHGDGGALSHKLIKEIFVAQLGNPMLNELSDAALFSVRQGKLAVSTDSFVVDPIFFPGGDIGKLAVCGTVNDLAVSGAVPRYLTASFIIEEGLPLKDLKMITASMAETARAAGVQVVAGDTKVVERGHGDKVFINTAGIGFLSDAGSSLSYSRIKPGDKVIINGSIGDHGMTILSQREGFSVSSGLKSDCAPLNGIIEELLEGVDGIKFMRDPTRGGVATTLNEIASSSGWDVMLFEEKIPLRKEVTGASAMLGLDPLYLANEGKFLAIVDKIHAEPAVDILRRHPLGREAAIIGEISEGKSNVYLKTPIGGTKRLNTLAGAPLPRIC